MSAPQVAQEPRNIFTIRVVYKCGYTHDFDVYEFKFGGGRFAWDAVSDGNRPLLLGVEDIMAIWQVGVRQESV